MNKTLIKDTLRQVWATKSRFFSILAIIAIGSAFFAGLKATCPDMLLTAKKYYEDYNLMDIHMLSSVGFDEESVEQISEYDDIKSLYAGYSADLFIDMEERADFIAKVYSLDSTGNINAPELIEGRMPQNKNECLIEITSMTQGYLDIGGEITFLTNDSERELEDILSGDTYTIVGIVRWPMYVGFERGATSLGNGSLDTYILLMDEAFSYENYTDIFLTLNSVQGMAPYTEEYEGRIEQTIDYLEAYGEEFILPNLVQRVLADANEELADAREEYNDGLKE